MKKLLMLAAAGAAAYYALNKAKANQNTQDLWAEATDSVRKSEN